MKIKEAVDSKWLFKDWGEKKEKRVKAHLEKWAVGNTCKARANWYHKEFYMDVFSLLHSSIKFLHSLYCL